MRGLKDKVCVITGAAGGIGRALCARFLEEGAQVVAADNNTVALAALGDELAGKARLVELDITDHAAVAAAVTATKQALGRIDVLVNNAGWDVPVEFVATTPEFWAKCISINLTGPLNMHHAILPHMIKDGGGMVVNIASDAGRVGSSGESVYSACKGGIIAFTKTVARECAKHNIRLNVVCPGPTDTPLLQSFVGEGEFGQKVYEGLKRSIPLKRLGRPDDLTGIVAFMASDDAAFITGQVISVSGGLTMHG
jgi:2-hydroxycyclohexanecarboxyl-CoA dehydrogenase